MDGHGGKYAMRGSDVAERAKRIRESARGVGMERLG